MIVARTLRKNKNSMSRNDDIRRNARCWRDDEKDFAPVLASITNKRRRASSVCRNRTSESKSLWDREGNLIPDPPKKSSTRNEESFTSARSSSSLSSRQAGTKPEWSSKRSIEYKDASQLPKQKKRASSVTRQSLQETLERLSASRKPKVEEKPKRPTNLDFAGFLQRQSDSTKARIEAMKPKEAPKAEISAGSRAILRHRNTRSIMDDTLEPRQIIEVEPAPQKTIKETSRRLVDMDLAAERERKAKKTELLQKLISEEKEPEIPEKKKPVKRAPMKSVKTENEGQTVAAERKKIEKRAVELQVIVDEQNKEKWVKPKYGQIPKYIRDLTKAIPREKRYPSATTTPRRDRKSK